MYQFISTGIINAGEAGIVKESVMKDAIIEKALDLIPKGEALTSDIKHKRFGDFHIVYLESMRVGNSPEFTMKRCQWAVYSALLLDRFYYSTEVVDKKHSYTFHQIQTMFKNYFSHVLKNINEVI